MATAGDSYGTVNINSLDRHDLEEYRQELITAIQNPGIEYETIDSTAEEFYRKRLAAVNALLAETTGSPEGGNL